MLIRYNHNPVLDNLIAFADGDAFVVKKAMSKARKASDQIDPLRKTLNAPLVAHFINVVLDRKPGDKPEPNWAKILEQKSRRRRGDALSSSGPN